MLYRNTNGSRMLALFTACLLLLSSFAFLGNAPQALAANVIETSAQPNAPTVAQGGSVTINTNVTMSEAASLLIDIEIFDASLKKVHQEFIDNVAASAGVSKTVPFVWKVPANLPQGKYIISFGVFGSGWSTMHKWHAAAAEITVGPGTGTGTDPGQGGGTPLTFTSAAAATPEQAAPGSAVKLDASVTAAVYGNAVVEIGVIQPNGTRTVLQSSAESFGTAETKRFPLQWAVPADAAAGGYKVDINVYSLDRKQLYHQNGSAASFTVAANTSAKPIKVSVQTGASSSVQMPSPGFEIYNVSQSPVALKDVKARYYFTIDSEKPLSIGFWSTVTKSAVTTTFVRMPIPSAAADYYLEIGFTDAAGTLQPGAKAGVYTWINKSDWSVFEQSNDYSFTNTSEWKDSDKTTGYISGKLVWGTEPVLFDQPAYPMNVKAAPADTSITVTWDAVEGATGYDVEADGTVVVTNAAGTSYTHEWLNPGTRHTYKVKARKGTSSSIWSEPLSVKTTGQQVLPAPVNVKAKATDSTVALTWDALAESITGYEVEADGTVIGTGMTTSYTHSGLTPGSKHSYRVRAKDGETAGAWSALIGVNTVYVPTGPFKVNISVDTAAERAPISPYIYGTNDDLTGTENWTSRRLGGNRMSTYNWENNASNAGSDWMQSSDGFIPWFYGGVPFSDHDIPGIGATAFHDKSLKQRAYSLITLQSAGYVAKDRNGPVSASEQAPSSRWAEVKASKGAPFSLTPDLNDNYVYMDEFVNFLVNRFGKASSPTGIKGYALDNEPALWPSTHPLMHPAKTGSAEVLNKSIELAKAVKRVDPTAETFGPVLYGFSEYFNMDNATDWNQVKGNYKWYIDYYLDRMRIESAKDNKRLLDVLDLHWYPEVSAGGVRITTSDTNDNIAVNKARMQAPRSLWDPSYTEESWIGRWYGDFLPLIPRTKQSIDMYNPGTKLAFSEYNYGGEGHVSGGIATADVLGIFGKYDVYMANYWKMVSDTAQAPYTSAAFKIYNNYDGQNSKFGDTRVKAETSDIENSSVYGSVYKDSDNKLHLIVMNKNYDFDMNAVLNIAGNTQYTSARVWAFDEANAAITERQPVTAIRNNAFTYTIPKLTVCHIVLSAD